MGLNKKGIPSYARVSRISKKQFVFQNVFCNKKNVYTFRYELYLKHGNGIRINHTVKFQCCLFFKYYFFLIKLTNMFLFIDKLIIL